MKAVKTIQPSSENALAPRAPSYFTPRSFHAPQDQEQGDEKEGRIGLPEQPKVRNILGQPRQASGSWNHPVQMMTKRLGRALTPDEMAQARAQGEQNYLSKTGHGRAAHGKRASSTPKKVIEQQTAKSKQKAINEVIQLATANVQTPKTGFYSHSGYLRAPSPLSSQLVVQRTLLWNTLVEGGRIIADKFLGEGTTDLVIDALDPSNNLSLRERAYRIVAAAANASMENLSTVLTALGASPQLIELVELAEQQRDIEALFQRKFKSNSRPPMPSKLSVATGNNTGLPDQLKAGVEALSGMDMAAVRVFTNSTMPAKLNALAYAQGNEIYLGPGQEKHLPHEAWHIVQQRQGLVKPTLKAGGVAINDDPKLEKEADVMGTKGLDAGKLIAKNTSVKFSPEPHPLQVGLLNMQPLVQREIRGEDIQAQKEKDFDYQVKKLRKFVEDHEELVGKLEQARKNRDPKRIELSQAVSKNQTRYNETKSLLTAIDKEPEQSRKVELLFSDKFGKAIEDAEKQAGAAFEKAGKLSQAGRLSPSEAARAKVVLGRTSDTWAVQNAEEIKALLAVDPNYYTLALNDAFMKGGIDLKAEFQLVTQLQDETKEFLKKPGVTSKDLYEYAKKKKDQEKLLWSDWQGGQPSVSCRELGQLLDDGYRYYEVPGSTKSEIKQMMIPKKNEKLLEDIRKKSKERKS